MVLIEQAVEERLLCRTPDLPKLERSDGSQAGMDRCGIHARMDRLATLFRTFAQGIGHNKPHRRQFDMACPMQLQHETPTHHVA
jgi:hypothetical protein